VFTFEFQFEFWGVLPALFYPYGAFLSESRPAVSSNQRTFEVGGVTHMAAKHHTPQLYKWRISGVVCSARFCAPCLESIHSTAGLRAVKETLLAFAALAERVSDWGESLAQ
jgi:hypothetical protein